MQLRERELKKVELFTYICRFGRGGGHRRDAASRTQGNEMKLQKGCDVAGCRCRFGLQFFFFMEGGPACGCRLEAGGTSYMHV